MTSWNDLPEEMWGPKLDRDTLERLLTGRVDPDDAPPGYAEVARLLNVIARTPAAETTANEGRLVAIAVDRLRAGAVSTTREEISMEMPMERPTEVRRRTRHRLKVAGVVLAGALLGSTGLAAAGVLPDAAQDAFARVLDAVGISVPAGSDHPATSGEEIAGLATTTDASGVGKGAEVSSAASGGTSQAGQHGPTDTTIEGVDGAEAPVVVPNDGGTGTADAASDGVSEEGTGTADEWSDGRSDSGSDNATVEPAPPTPTPEPPPVP